MMNKICLSRFLIGLFSFFLFNAPTSLAFDCSKNIIPEKSLLIIDKDIVNSPNAKSNGSFGFATLFKRALVHDSQAGEAAYDWLNQFHEVKTFNGYKLPERRPKPLFDIWPIKRHAASSQSRPALDLDKAPFVLLAIVFRPDLATTKGFGELRFVFGAIDKNGDAPDLGIIFEFSLTPSSRYPTKKSWFEAFASLSNASNHKDYLNKLSTLVDSGTEPSGGLTRLAKLRTNDQFFGQGWDLREFVVDQARAKISTHEVDKTPDFALARAKQAKLVNWINRNSKFILANDYSLPKEFRSASAFFLDDQFQWLKDSGIEEDVRQKFAENTCSGCHGGETNTSFFHIRPRQADDEAIISDFLKRNIQERSEILKGELCD